MAKIKIVTNDVPPAYGLPEDELGVAWGVYGAANFIVLRHNDLVHICLEGESKFECPLKYSEAAWQNFRPITSVSVG